MKITEIAFSCHPVTMARALSDGVLGPNGVLSLGAGVPDWKPTSSGCSVGLEVEDLKASIAHLREKRVTYMMEPFPTPSCRMAFILDPDLNARGPGEWD